MYNYSFRSTLFSLTKKKLETDIILKNNTILILSYAFRNQRNLRSGDALASFSMDICLTNIIGV